jgi:peptidoglycan/xylan/chitin deacetylase (PgdA/CDA1 family)
MVAVAAGLFLDTTPGFFSFVLTLIAGMGFLLAVGTYSARVQRTLVGVGVAIAVVTALVVGATSPRVSWFGRTITHGPRDVPTVALTFDDGPNRASTLAVRDVLDQYGVKGTFFLVGSAVDAAPEIARALVDDGQLVGSHAYEHNSWDWLDPRYTELDRSLASMRQQLGVCPGFLRPPHGYHTPFMTHRATRAGMRTVMWDDSAADWATNDADLVARRILQKVRPGSIILLHDGLDGDVTSDRSVVVRALPQILDGLLARGLRPVRLDELLGGPGYVTPCDAGAGASP